MTTYTWLNAAGGRWSVQSNWMHPSGSPAGYPVAGDSAVIDLSGTYTIDATGQSFATATLDSSGATLQILTAVSETALSISGSLTITAGTFEIDAASNSGLYLTISGASASIVNYGAILMQGPLGPSGNTETVTFAPSIENHATFSLGAFNRAYLEGASTINDPGGTIDASQGNFLEVDTPSNPGTGSGTLQNAGTVKLGGGASANLTAVTTPQGGSAGTILFTDGNENTLTLNDIEIDATTVTSTIAGFQAGDTIDVANVAPSGAPDSAVTTFDGTTLTLTDGGSTTYATLSFSGLPGNASFSAVQDLGGTGFDITTSFVPCFAAGTRVATSRGAVAVEALRIGDGVQTPEGVRPVIWIGQRRIDLARHPRPDSVRPVRITRDAFAAGMPSRDLLLSPDHAVFWEGVLIEAKHLLNAMTIAQVDLASVTYFHVELARHGVIFAEDLACETYLDTGNRGMFANATAPRVLHPDFAGARVGACAPLVFAGARLAELRRHLRGRAEKLGHSTTFDPGLYLLADGMRRDAQALGDGRLRFALPRGAREIRLVSRVAVPSQLVAESSDTRRLGIAVSALRLQTSRGTRALALDDPAFATGWYAPEEACRWSDGDARLDLPAPALLEIALRRTLPYALAGRRAA